MAIGYIQDTLCLVGRRRHDFRRRDPRRLHTVGGVERNEALIYGLLQRTMGDHMGMVDGTGRLPVL